MSRYITTVLVSLVSLVVMLLLADVSAGATGDGPIFQGYLAVLFHALGYCVVAATAAYLASAPFQLSSTQE